MKIASGIFQGGGGLVQQLKKSYSLSDLTGEKEDENRITSAAHDETDMIGIISRVNGRLAGGITHVESINNFHVLFFSGTSSERASW